MRNDKLIPGAILVIIGILFLLHNFGVIDFSWTSFMSLWPMILVIIGVNLLFTQKHSAGATAVKVGVLILGMGFLIYAGLTRHQYGNSWYRGFDSRHFNYDYDDSSDDHDDETITKVEGSGHYKEDYTPGIKQATLNITGGGASYVLKDVTNNLVEADTKEYSTKFMLTSNGDSTTQNVNFDMNGEHHEGGNFDFGKTRSNNAVLKLNNNPVWDINVQAGAAKVDFDLTSFKISKLTLEGGAGSFKIKMGQPISETNVEISTGVSEVVVSVPQNAACRITTEAGLSSKKIDGFQNTGDDEYETPGFANATSKMYIKLSGGISRFKVKQY